MIILQNGNGFSNTCLKNVRMFVVEYISGLLKNVYIFNDIAIIRTIISENIILSLVTKRTGKSIRNPASAIGVQSTKNDRVRAVTKKLFSTQYFFTIKRKYPINITTSKINFRKVCFLVSCFIKSCLDVFFHRKENGIIFCISKIFLLKNNVYYFSWNINNFLWISAKISRKFLVVLDCFYY